MILTKDHDALKTILLTIKLKYPTCLLQNTVTISDKNIIRECIKDKTYLNTSDVIDNGSKFKKLSKYCSIMIRNAFIIPDYLNKYTEFIFWIQKRIEYKYPLNITTRDKFKEYRNALKILSELNGLNQLKEKGIICSWINNVTDAEKFIWLDHSNIIKKWKESQVAFNNSFSQTFGLHSQNIPFVNFVSLTN